MEYSDTMTFEGGKITTFYEFVDSYTLKNTFYNESVAAAACGK
jgi:ketosteroid isomerase-like protein